MSRLADKRYADPAWTAFRALLSAWEMCGGFPALSIRFGVSESRLHTWRLGVSTPGDKKRDEVATYIRDRAGGGIALGLAHAQATAESSAEDA